MHALRLWTMVPKGRRSRRSRTVRCDNHRHDRGLVMGFRLTPEDADGRECVVCGAPQGGDT